MNEWTHIAIISTLLLWSTVVSTTATTIDHDQFQSSEAIVGAKMRQWDVNAQHTHRKRWPHYQKEVERESTSEKHCILSQYFAAESLTLLTSDIGLPLLLLLLQLRLALPLLPPLHTALQTTADKIVYSSNFWKRGSPSSSASDGSHNRSEWTAAAAATVAKVEHDVLPRKPNSWSPRWWWWWCTTWSSRVWRRKWWWLHKVHSGCCCSFLMSKKAWIKQPAKVFAEVCPLKHCKITELIGHWEWGWATECNWGSSRSTLLNCKRF